MAMLGAGVMLSACSPVQMGAAAIVGNQRISQAALASNVTDMQNMLTAYQVPAGALQISPTTFPQTVLSAMTQFAQMHKLAQIAGVKVTQAQINHQLDQYQAGLKSAAKQTVEEQIQQGAQYSPKKKKKLVNAYEKAEQADGGIGPNLLPDLGRYFVERAALEMKFNHGKLPSASNQAESEAVQTALDQLAVKHKAELTVKVNPQYGKINTSGAIAVAPDTLSKPAGGTSAAVAPASVSAP